MTKIRKIVFFLCLSIGMTNLLQGQTSSSDFEGIWKLAPQAGALAVGPSLGDYSWWATDGAFLTEGVCLFDDKFVFNADGSFMNVQQSQTWVETWQGPTVNECNAPAAPHDGSNAATWSYDGVGGTIILTGVGAHLGFAKIANGFELETPGDAPASITYIVTLSNGGNTMTAEIESTTPDGTPSAWRFILEKENEIPNISGTWEIAPEVGALAVGPSLGDYSWWASDMTTVTQRACLFDDQFVFNENGTFMNVQQNETWIESWQGGLPSGSCDVPVAPHDGSNAATWSYDNIFETITITGVGGHLGLPKVVNGAELTSSASAPASVTYPVSFSDEGNTMTVEIDIGNGFWKFVLKRKFFPFITTWQTDNLGSSNNTSITIPTNPAYTYDYDVDWDNDGTFDDLGVTGNITHDYGTAGTYQIAIRGRFPAIMFNGTTDKEKITSIDQWGDIEWESMRNAFNGCINMGYAAVDAPDLSEVTDMSSMFLAATAFNGDLNNWDVSNVTDMRYMFHDANSFNSNLNNWDVSNVTDMQSMFDGAYSFNGDLSNWNVGNVTKMLAMFRNAYSFNGDLSSWNVGSVTYMYSMFHGASSFNSDLANWDISNVSELYSMFEGASSFDRDLGNWDISNVCCMHNMLDNSGMSAENYDNTLAGWAAQTVALNVELGAVGIAYCNGEIARNALINSHGWNIIGDILDCPPSSLFITTWQTDNPGISNNTSVAISTNPAYTYNYDVDWDNDGIFDDLGVTGNITHDYGTVGTYQVAIRGTFPAIYFGVPGTQNDKKKVVSLDQWGTMSWKSMHRAFMSCSNMTYAAMDVPDLSAVTDMSYMFADAFLFNGSVDTWDVSNVTDMSFMFINAFAFNGNVGTWDVSNVTDMTHLFTWATSFDENLGTWDISNVTNMTNMLDNAGLSLENYDNTLIGWAAQTVQFNIFLGATGLNYCNGEAARNTLMNTHGWIIFGDALDCPPDCMTPSNIQVDITSQTSALFTWDAIPDATNYQVWYRIKGTSDWTIKGGASPQRNLTGLTKNKYYQYKLRTSCPSGWSDFSDIGIFYSSVCGDIPTGIASVYLDNTRMRIRWDNTDEVKAKVRYREVGTSTWYTKNSADGNNYVYIAGLTPNATYQYRVRSNCSDNNWSAYSISYFHNLSGPSNRVTTEASKINLYPNPVSNVLNIEFETSTEKEIRITITNQVGKVIHTLNQSYGEGIQRESIDMSAFANGYYFITIQGDDMMKTLKFVKVE